MLPIHMTAFLSLSAPLKNKLQKATHAQNGNWDAVEMESYAIAEVAEKHGIPLLQVRTTVDGKATAYVCRNNVCMLPVTDPSHLVQQMMTG